MSRTQSSLSRGLPQRVQLESKSLSFSHWMYDCTVHCVGEVEIETIKAGLAQLYGVGPFALPAHGAVPLPDAQCLPSCGSPPYSFRKRSPDARSRTASSPAAWDTCTDPSPSLVCVFAAGRPFVFPLQMHCFRSIFARRCYRQCIGHVSCSFFYGFGREHPPRTMTARLHQKRSDSV